MQKKSDALLKAISAINSADETKIQPTMFIEIIKYLYNKRHQAKVYKPAIHL
jgi:hypothetical protein